MIMIDRY